MRFAAGALLPSCAPAQRRPTELARVLARVMARPDIRAEQGFDAHVLAPPGEMYDPLFMRDQGAAVWINDLGGINGEKGGAIWAVARNGEVATVIGIGRLLPPTGFDIAPASFGPYAGQIFTVSQPEITLTGSRKNHVIQRVDPKADDNASIFCTLPPISGPQGNVVAGWGSEGRFGPEGSPFSGKFFAIAAMSNTIYQATPDGHCAPFVTFDGPTWGMPVALTFSPDGRYMVVTTQKFALDQISDLGHDVGKLAGVGNEEQGVIVRVLADGSVDPKALVRADNKVLGGLAYAPTGFGKYAGQLFVAVFGKGQAQQTYPAPGDGELYRLTPEGDLKRVASGLRKPIGVHFVGQHLWVTNVNGDFNRETERRELPDGFVAEIIPTGAPSRP